jgi:HlyD family secretion protein
MHASTAFNPGETTMNAPSRPQPTRRRRGLRAGIAAITVGALALAGGGVALATASTSGGEYRTATVRSGDVTQVVDAVGTVAAAERYDLAFGVAGSVASVSVSVGDRVAAGTVLATLDTEALQQAVDEARSALDEAEGQLTTDTTAQSSASTSSTATSADPAAATTQSSSLSSSSSSSSPVGSEPSASTAEDGGGTSVDQAVIDTAVAAVEEAQSALLAQYDAVNAGLAASNDAIVGSGTACQPFLDAALAEQTSATTTEGEDASTTVEGTASDVPSSETETTATLDDGVSAIAESLDACQAAIGTVLESQTVVDGAQATLVEMSSALDGAVDDLQRVVAEESASSGGDSGQDGSDSETPSSGSVEEQATESSGSGSSGTEAAGETSGTAAGATPTVTVTAETLLADKAAIALAEQRLTMAEQALATNTISAPVSGIVAAVAIAAGDSVEAASESAVITVLADGGYVVETTLPLTDVRSTAVGQSADVTLEGDSEALVGTVSSIGVLDVSETSTPSYAVTIALDDTEAEPLTGTVASLEIAAASATDALVVPTSAVHVSGSEATVDVLVDGTARSQPVDVGAVGADYTEIVDGLDEGTLVVLADLSAEIATDEDDTSSGLTGIGGSEGGGGAGGPTGGAPAGGTPPGGDVLPGG